MLLLSGCGLMAKAPDEGGRQANGVVPPKVAAFLTNAEAGVQAHFVTTPWGEGVRMTVEAAYDAASGRVCRQVVLQGAEAASGLWVFCQRDAEQWDKVRPVIRVISEGGYS